MANNDNVVKIGTALKWRGVYDLTKKYYQENIVTENGCVFRCKVLSAIGENPVKITDEQGHIVYQNTDIWDVLVDMAYYYNYLVDNRKLTKELQEYCKKLNDLIIALQEDNKLQWEHIKALEKFAEETKIQLDPLVNTFCCFSEGIWIDTLSWNNELIWDNNKYAITDDLQRQINELSERHDNELKELTDKHDKDVKDINNRIDTFEKEQGKVNDYLTDQVERFSNAFSCFSTGIWLNELNWDNHSYWDNNKYEITDDLQRQINELSAHHEEDVDSIRKQHKQDTDTINEHLNTFEKNQNAVNDYVLDQLEDLSDTLSCFSTGIWENDFKWGNSAIWDNNKFAITDDLQEQINELKDTDKQHDLLFEQNKKEHQEFVKELQSHQDLLNEHDKQIFDLVEGLTCFGFGQWFNELKWSNSTLWENSNEMTDTFEDLYRIIEENRNRSIKEHNALIEEDKRINSRIDGDEDRIAALETENKEQQREIDSLLHRISVVSNGIWDNAMLWVNDSEWLNDGTGTGMPCHCPADLEERIDNLDESLKATNENVEKNKEEIDKNAENISANAQNISNLSTDFDEAKADYETFKKDSIAKDKDFAYQFRQNTRDHAAINENIEKIGTHFGCFADGLWGDLFQWRNEDLWANETGVILSAINEIREETNELNNTDDEIKKELESIHQDIKKTDDSLTETNQELESFEKEQKDLHKDINYQFREISRQQETQNEEIAKIGQHFGCFEDGIWCDLFYWCNDQLWSNNDEESNVHVELAQHDQRLSAMENMLQALIGQLNEQKEQISKQRAQLDDINDCFSVTNMGKWPNSLLWNNDHTWLNSLIADNICNCTGSGYAGLVNYDPPTQTVSAYSNGADITYDEPTKTLGVEDAKVGFAYDEKEQSISIK